MLTIIIILMVLLVGVMIATAYLGMHLATIAILSSTITTVILIIIFYMKNKRDMEKAEIEFAGKEEKDNSKTEKIKNELLSYYKEGYIITDKLGKFKLNKKTKKMYLDVDFIKNIYVIDDYSDNIKKAYKVMYDVNSIYNQMEENKQKKYRVNKTFLVHGL